MLMIKAIKSPNNLDLNSPKTYEYVVLRELAVKEIAP